MKSCGTDQGRLFVTQDDLEEYSCNLSNQMLLTLMEST